MNGPGSGGGITAPVLGAVLAGGLARRMGGGDKPLRPFAGGTLLGHVLARLRPQVAALLLNANGNPARFAAYGVPVAADGVPNNPGPLAGILAALDWGAAQGFGWVCTVPGDSPLIPADLVPRFRAAAAAGNPACARSGGRVHPPVGLWPVRLRHPLRAALAAGEGRVARWAVGEGCVAVDWDDAPLDPFLNVNTPEELAAAERAVAAA